jgi:hypothetical protein
MKRQRGRNRGGGGNSSGKPQQQNANRAFDSNGPEGVKVRGNAQHVFEKYQQLARDANAAGDRVLGENYLQHAEHYFRLLRAMQPMRPASEILGRDHFSSGFDIDFEDEGAQAQAEAADEAAAEAVARGDVAPQPQGEGEPRGEQQPRWENRSDRPRDDRQRDDRPREGRDRDRGERSEGRRDRWRDDRPRGDDRPRADGNRDDRPRDDRPRDDRPRDDRPREDRNRDDRPRDDRPRADRDDRPRGDRDERPRDDREGGRRERSDREERRDRDPMPVVEPQGSGFGGDERPTPVLRDSDGGESHAPAFLQARAEPRPEGGEEKRPRRRRAPRSFDAGEGAPPASEAEEV